MSLLSVANRLARLQLRARGVGQTRVATSLGAVSAFVADGAGDLPPVVLLHGIGSAAASYARVLVALRPHVRRVVAIDAPGHGLSDPPRVPLTPETMSIAMREAFAALVPPPARVVLVGVSLGGAVALHLAIDEAPRVLGVLACSPGGAGATDAELAALLTTFDLSDRRAAVDFVRRLFARPPWYAPILTPYVRASLAQPSVRSFLAASRASDLFTAAQIASIACPVRLVWGRGDRLLPSAHLDFFRAHAPPHWRIDEPPHFGHSPQLEWPRDLAARIVDFARELGGRG